MCSIDTMGSMNRSPFNYLMEVVEEKIHNAKHESSSSPSYDSYPPSSCSSSQDDYSPDGHMIIDDMIKDGGDESLAISALLELAGVSSSQPSSQSSTGSSSQSSCVSQSSSNSTVNGVSGCPILISRSQSGVNHVSKSHQKMYSLPSGVELFLGKNNRQIHSTDSVHVISSDQLSSSRPLVGLSSNGSSPRIVCASSIPMSVITSVASGSSDKNKMSQYSLDSNHSNQFVAYYRVGHNLHHVSNSQNRNQLNVNNSSDCLSSGGESSSCHSGTSNTMRQKKRGRKRVSDDMMDGWNQESTRTSNAIKEFRQRQRLREKSEDTQLYLLESEYQKRYDTGEFEGPLDQFYDEKSLNIKFERVKTLNKRGKAADEDERTNRKKECARRDSKNYRERAKQKRDLIVNKIRRLNEFFRMRGINIQNNTKLEYLFT